MPRLPDFLVVGAMKSGTTSMFFDLGANPAICLAEKEANHLLSDRVLEESGTTDYAREFRGATAQQVCGEVSSAYTKLPDLPGVPTRARKVCGDALKILYLVREPVDRLISHHYHDVAAGKMDPDLEVALRERRCLLDYSRYAMQLEPWMETFGSRQTKVVQFERYIVDRRGTFEEIADFLGVEPHSDLLRADRVYNRSLGKPAPAGRIWAWSRGRSYQRWLRPLLPRPVRERLVGFLLPQAPPPPAPPKLSTVDWILDELREDSMSLQTMLDLEQPLWDFAEVRKRFATRATG